MARDLEKYVAQAKADYKQKELDRLGLSLEDAHHYQIVYFFSLLYDEVERGGIATAEEKNNFFIKDFCDSIQPLLLFGFGRNSTMLDVRGRAGFPSIPVAIFRRDMKIHVLEEDSARYQFLKDCVEYCGLENVTLHESQATLKKLKFDYVVQRGSETLQDFTRIARDYIMSTGRMYTFETTNFHEELSEITSHKDEEGVCVSEIIEYDLANKIMGLSLVAFDLYNG